VTINCQQICKISCKKRLNRSENIPKSFRGVPYSYPQQRVEDEHC